MEVVVVIAVVVVLALLVPVAWWSERRRRRRDALLLADLDRTVQRLEELNLRMGAIPAGADNDPAQPLDG